jgi:cytoskeletal protein CcmA (bactofilin family)
MLMNRDAQGNPSTRPSSNPSGSSADTRGYLGPGLRIEGEITGNEDLLLDSQMKGSISIGGFRLTIGPSAHVDGEIVAREVVVLGEVTGNINARDRLESKKGSTVIGDLSTSRIAIEEGAYLNGAIETDSSKTLIGADLDTLLGKVK